MMCSVSKEWLSRGFDFSGLGNPITWIDFCMVSKGAASWPFSVSPSSDLRKVAGRINTVSKSFEGNRAESLES